MSDTLIVNASPLVFLGNAGRLELLQVLEAERVVVPVAVRREVTESSHCDRASRSLAAAAWIESAETLAVPESVLRWDLDSGEAQVVAVGLANQPARLLIDDLAGRRCAIAHGFNVIGTLGLVAAGYKRGVITDPEAVFEELRIAGMWISDRVLARALALLNEK